MELAERTLAGVSEKILLIVVEDARSLQTNPEFVRQMSEQAKEARVIYIDRRSDSNIKAFDASLYDAISKPGTIYT